MSTKAETESPWGGHPSDSTHSPLMSPGLSVAFVGRRGALFWLALKTGFFTILTLGFYRFWMKTRLRRWYWSAIRPGGHPLEYVGDPIEKLLGFFIAVLVLTFYLGIVNLGVMFASFSLTSAAWPGYLFSFAGVIPIWFYARYRARRYVLGRTRWRGVRFGLEDGAWGYAGRALWHWMVTILTLGALWPRMTFYLEKYRTDRTFFGSTRLVQGGRWQMLYRAAVPFALAMASLIAFTGWIMVLDPILAEPTKPDDVLMLLRTGAELSSFHQPERLRAFPILLFALGYGAIHYRWAAKRIMANHKTAEGITFASRLSGPRVAMIYALGSFISYLTLLVGIGFLAFLAVSTLSPAALIEADSEIAQFFGSLPRWVTLLVFGFVYLAAFLLWGVLHNTFVTFPIMRHMAQTVTIPVSVGIADISQRDREALAQAEGFAEALDLGAAI